MSKPRLILVSLLAPLLLGAGSEAPPADVAAARSTVSRWITTQELKFKERRDWQEGKEVLTARTEAAESEIAALEVKLAASQEKLDTLRRARRETEATERGLVESADRLTDMAVGLEEDVRRVYPLLPTAMQEKIGPLYRRMPEPGAVSKVAPAERFQNVVGILNEIQKANSEITLLTEIRALSDGKPSEVKTVYLGLGQAYFLSAGGEAGIGRPTATGWEWQAANELAPLIHETIEILENKGKPKFIPLPVSIQ
jgi:hypothetical protein